MQLLRTIGAAIRLFILLASALFVCLFVTGLREAEITAALKVLAIALLVLMAVSPSWGLMALALALPLAPLIQIYSASRIAFAETAEFLVLPCLVAGSVPLVRRGAGPARGPALALVSLSVVVAVSTLAHVAVQLRAPWVRTSQVLMRHFVTDYFVATNAFRGLHSATSWIEGSTLALVAIGVLADPRSRARLVTACVLAGGTAAAWFSVRRLIQVSVARPHPIATAIGFLGTLRFHPFYPDVNAAGSYLVLFAVPVLWRALKTSWWWPAAVTVTLALWLTGSRSATVAGAFGCMCCWLMSRRTGRRGLIVGLIAAIVIAGGVFMIPSGAHTDFGSGVGIRIELAWLGLQAAASSPLLGVGLDKLKPIVGENAHNQFVQILAEMGIAGFAAFLWVLIAAAAQVRAALKRSAAVDPALAGLSGGLIAFLFSSFFGHPFLTSEVLLAFMLVLGVTVGISATR